MKILGDLHAGAGPSWLKDSTPAPERGTVAYSIDGRSRTGDLYRPGRPSAGALVLVPGAAAAGKDDPRLVAFATTLVRARFLVLVPDMAGLRQLRVSAADAREIADAVRWVSASAARPTDHPVGIAAISFAVGPAVLAALEPDVRGRVRFILGVGAYYDLAAVITYVTTGSFKDRGSAEWRREQPNPYGAWLFALTNADRLPEAGDRALVSEMAGRMLADRAADVSDLAARLGAGGRAVFEVIANRDPVRAPSLIARLPEPVRREITLLDLSGRDLAALGARLILVHGRDDRVIPYGESIALAAARPAGEAYTYIVDNLAHVDLSVGGLWDAFTLWRAVYRLLRERDRAADARRSVASDLDPGARRLLP
ncbi:MAG: alpha/beta hydrolase [Alphaproteobacteria bacterium]